MEAKTALRSVSGAPACFLSSVSFEDRWDGAALIAEAEGVQPQGALFLFPIDDQGRWKAACTAKQEANWQRYLGKTSWRPKRTDVPLLADPPPWDIALAALDDLARGQQNLTLIIDISTMPKVCFFPVVKRAMQSPQIANVLVAYSRPLSYGLETLFSEPTRSTIIPGFDRLDPSYTGNTAWVPILGFSAPFAAKIYEDFVESYKVETRVFPFLGFPAFEPSFFERALRDGGQGILDRVSGARHVVQRQIRYAAASDPFETRTELLRLLDSAGEPMQWLASPLGPKPMSLGLLLVALERDVTVVTCQPRSYHPDYSAGTGQTHVYFLKRGGRRAY